MAYTNHNDLLAPYLALPQGDKVQAECMFISSLFSSIFKSNFADVWIDGDGGLRSKTTVRSSLLPPFLILCFSSQSGN
jgi:glutamine synthetase